MVIVKPVLDTHSVLVALECINDGRPLPSSHPLLGFVLIRDQLERPESLPGEYAELHAVREELLISFTAVLDLEVREDQTDLEIMKRDFQVENPFLEACSFLYFRFMRPDLGLTVERIAVLVNLVPRTLQRRMNRGLAYLAGDLTSREIEFRRQNRLMVLRSRIPYPKGRSLYGRERVVGQILESEMQGPVLITGPVGIGKRSIVAQAAHEMLDVLDDLHWIRLLPDMDCISQIQESLFGKKLSPIAFDLPAYFSQYRTLLVLDGIRSQHVDQLGVQLLGHVSIIGMSDEIHLDWPGTLVQIPPLTMDFARKLWESVCGQLDEKQFQRSFAFSEGNPQELLEFCRFSRMLPSDKATYLSTSHNYYMKLWDDLDKPVKALWYVSWLWGTEPLPEEPVSTLLKLRAEHFVAAVSSHILTGRDEHGAPVYDLNAGARRFIGMLDRQDHIYLEPFIEMPEQNTSTKLTYVTFWLELLARGLASRMAMANLEHVLKGMALLIPQLGLWARWASVLEECRHHLEPAAYWTLWFQLERSRIDRWLGRLADNRRELTRIVNDSGALGFFDLYTKGLLELAILSSYQHEWEVALEAVIEAENTMQRLGDAELAQVARRVKAGALVEVEPGAVLDYIDSDIDHDGTAASIIAQAQLKLKKFHSAIEYAEYAIKLLPRMTPNYGRALSLLGMILWHSGERTLSREYLQQAVNMLGSMDDVIGVARATNNLGVSYMADGETGKAAELWQRSLEMLLAVQDGAALEVVRKNLQTLDGANTSDLAPWLV